MMKRKRQKINAASINKLIRNYPLLIAEIKLMRIKLAFNLLPFQN